jgi:hypothetical protein
VNLDCMQIYDSRAGSSLLLLLSLLLRWHGEGGGDVRIQGHFLESVLEEPGCSFSLKVVLGIADVLCSVSKVIATRW